MPCYNPKDARIVLANKKDAGEYPTERLNCARCHGCKREKARQWTIRLRHEEQLHERATAITLTYNDNHLPAGNSLLKADFQTFFDRFRTAEGSKLTYFMCGEYGETSTKRPHYHAVIFGTDFPDRYEWMHTGKSVQYRSPRLEQYWTKGFATVGDADQHTLNYVAGYVQKKIYGAEYQAEFYDRVHIATGELTQEARVPPYSSMSLRPAIGRRWIEQFHAEAYPSDFIVLDGRRLKPPRYYDRWLEDNHPDTWAQVKSNRAKERALRPVTPLKDLRARGQAAALLQAPYEERTL